MRFGSRGLSSSRIRHLNGLTEMAWVDAVRGLGKSALINSLSIRRFWRKRGREKGKRDNAKGEILTLPTPPFKISSPLARKEDLILRLTVFLN